MTRQVLFTYYLKIQEKSTLLFSHLCIIVGKTFLSYIFFFFLSIKKFFFVFFYFYIFKCVHNILLRDWLVTSTNFFTPDTYPVNSEASHSNRGSGEDLSRGPAHVLPTGLRGGLHADLLCFFVPLKLGKCNFLLLPLYLCLGVSEYLSLYL